MVGVCWIASALPRNDDAHRLIDLSTFLSTFDLQLRRQRGVGQHFL